VEIRLSNRLLERTNGLAVESHQSRTNNETKQTTSDDGQNSPTNRGPKCVKRWARNEIENRGDRDRDEKHLHDEENVPSSSIAPGIAFFAEWSRKFHRLVESKYDEEQKAIRPHVSLVRNVRRSTPGAFPRAQHVSDGGLVSESHDVRGKFSNERQRARTPSSEGERRSRG
jgi:hypothetical protein